MKLHPLELTKLECLFLSDALSMFAPGPPGNGEASPYPDLLLKILSAFLEADPAGTPVVVSMTQSDLWVIREVAKSSVSVGSEKVGLNLLTKVARGLLSVTAHGEIQALVDKMGETDQDEQGRAGYRSRLEKLKESSKRGGDSDARDNQDSG